MRTRAHYRIRDHPDIVFNEQHRPPMRAVMLPHVPVVFAFADSPFQVVFKAPQQAFGSEERLELPEMKHLIPAIDGNCIMALGSEKMIVELLEESRQLLAILITIGRKAKTKL